jgi:hypothetical protein
LLRNRCPAQTCQDQRDIKRAQAWSGGTIPRIFAIEGAKPWLADNVCPVVQAEHAQTSADEDLTDLIAKFAPDSTFLRKT